MESVHLKIRYGPYESHGIIRHKLQRLHGLIDLLNQEKYSLELTPSPHLNRLTIDMMDREIFSCDIRYFLYNLPPDKDVLCKKALMAIKEHEELFYTTRNQPQFSGVEEGMRFMSKQESVGSHIFYNMQTPQNSLRSSVHDMEDWRSCGEFTDFYRNHRYDAYDLTSADLIISMPESDEVREKNSYSKSSTTKSGLSDDYWICDDNSCYPTCPPASLAPEDSCFELKVNSLEEIARNEEIKEEEGYSKQITKDVEAEKISGDETNVERIDNIKENVGIGGVQVDEYSINEEGLYKCEQCDKCYCISD